MKVKVVGIQKIDYTNKVGRHVTGVNLHAMYTDNRTDGYSVDKFYLASDFPNLNLVKVNSDVDVYFNQYGKVDFLVVGK